jgi:hypothetical protein
LKSELPQLQPCRLQQALDKAGIIFIDADDKAGRGV